MKPRVWISALLLLATLSLVQLLSPHPIPEVASAAPGPERAQRRAPALVEPADPGRASAALGAGDLTLVVRAEHGAAEAGRPQRVAFVPAEGGAAVTFQVELDRPRSIHLPPGRYVVRADELETPSDALLWPQRVQVPDEPVPVPLELWLAPPCELTLEAADAEGAPVDGVPVMFRREGAEPVRRLLRTDERGSATTVLPAGDYAWSVESARFEVLEGVGGSALAGRAELSADEPARVLLALRPVAERALEVELVFASPQPEFEPELVTDLEVRWRGRGFRPLLEEDGVFRAREVLHGRRDAPAGPALVRLRGRGVREVDFEVPDPGAGVERLVVRHDVEVLTAAVECVLLDEDGEPLPRRRLELRVGQSERSTSYRHDLVRTDARGRFTIEGVEFPFQFFVANQALGRRYHPNDVLPMRVPDASELVKVHELPAHRVLLRIDDPDVASAAARSAGGPTLLDVLPLGRIARQLRTPWADALKELTPTEARRLGNNATIELADLPAGEYLATLFVPSHGTLTARFEVDPDEGRIEIPLGFRSGAASTGRVGGEGVALVVDGYVPRTLLSRIEQAAALERAGGARLSGAWSVPAAEGSFELTSHNALLSEWTVLHTDGRIERVPKGGPGLGGGDAFDEGGDGILQVRVLTADGTPAEGLAVNLTSVRGGERGGVVPWPKAEELLACRTGADGRYELSGVTPGSYTLSVADLEVGDEGRSRRFLVRSESVRLVDVHPGVQALELRLDPELPVAGPACDDPGHSHVH